MKIPFSLLFLLSVSALAEPVSDARSLIAQKLYQPALDILEKEVARESPKKEVIELYAQTLWFSKAWEKSIPWLERAAAGSDAETAKAWLLLKAKALSYLGRFRESVWQYSAIEKDIDPSDGLLWEHLVVALAGEEKEEVYIAVGKLAAMAKEENLDATVRARVKHQLEIYEAMTAKGLVDGSRLAKGTIESWKKK